MTIASEKSPDHRIAASFEGNCARVRRVARHLRDLRASDLMPRSPAACAKFKEWKSANIVLFKDGNMSFFDVAESECRGSDQVAQLLIAR